MDVELYSDGNMLFSLSVNDPTVDWTVRHGHAIALSAVLHDAVERMVSQGLYEDVTNAAVAHATTDRVSVTLGSREGKCLEVLRKKETRRMLRINKQKIPRSIEGQIN